jgi:hypothetical protein
MATRGGDFYPNVEIAFLGNSRHGDNAAVAIAQESNLKARR